MPNAMKRSGCCRRHVATDKLNTNHLFQLGQSLAVRVLSLDHYNGRARAGRRSRAPHGLAPSNSRMFRFALSA